MGFWIFMTVVDLLTPAIMILFGAIFSRRAPKSINFVYGYRTERSMKNEETWVFAHKFLGKLWLITGAIMLALSFAIMIIFINSSETVVSLVGTVLCFVQIAGLVIPIFPVESALEKNFDKNGNRK